MRHPRHEGRRPRGPRAPGTPGSGRPQLHTLAQLPRADALGFAGSLLALYAADLDDEALLATLDAGPLPWGLSVPWPRAALAGPLGSYDLATYVHTLDHGQQALGALEAGFHGVYTDRITPAAVQTEPWSGVALETRVTASRPLTRGVLLLDVLPWRGLSGARLSGRPPTSTSLLGITRDGTTRPLTVRDDGSLDPSRGADELVALLAPEAPELSVRWTPPEGPALQRRPHHEAWSAVTFTGTDEQTPPRLAGLALTLFNASDAPTQGTVRWQATDVERSGAHSVSLAPWRALTVTIPAHAGRVRADYRGDAVVIEPVWHDALFLHTR